MPIICLRQPLVDGGLITACSRVRLESVAAKRKIGTVKCIHHQYGVATEGYCATTFHLLSHSNIFFHKFIFRGIKIPPSRLSESVSAELSGLRAAPYPGYPGHIS